MFLLDSNIIILALKHQSKEQKLLEKVVKDQQLFISVISIGEILVKTSKKEEKVFNGLVDVANILPLDEESARIAAKYRKKYLKKSRTKLLDYFIAAQAKLHKLTLVTNNKVDFPMKDIKIVSP